MSNITPSEMGAPNDFSSFPSVASHQQISNDEHNIPFIPAFLTVFNLQYEITVKEQPKAGKKRSFFHKVPNIQRALLSDVTVKAMPGRVLAIMGPSGSGKTTLLDLIANRQARNIGKLQGEILLNGIPVKQCGSIRKRLFGYVTQDDELMETMTVLDTLTFAAKLRLPRSMSNQEKHARVQSVMQELNLTHIKDTKIGGAVIRGISGGEKRRVVIGIELLSSPSVLVLDEPTSGLSSTDALNVAHVIKNLSTKGRTIILTVHQPRSDIYELFDDLLLLCQGKVAYFGKAQSTATYFEGLGYECPAGWNVADYFLDLITRHQENSLEKAPSAHEDFAKMYSNYLSTNPEAYLTQLLREPVVSSENIEGKALLSKFKKEYTTEYATTTLTQILLITQRSLTNFARHPTILQAAVATHIIFALVIGSLFSGLRDSPEMGVINFNTSISLFVLISFLATMTFSAMPQSKTIVETLSHTILSIIFVVITYYLIGLHGSIIYYFIIFAAFENVSLSLIAAIGAGANNTEVGMNLFALINTTAMLFSGFLVCRANIPRGWTWAFWGSYFQWAFSGMLYNEFSDGSAKGIATLAYFGMNKVEWLNSWNSALILLGYYIFFRVIGLLLMLSMKA
ncbi:ATP-binding cassette sub- G member 2 [Haplosporangium bisporale]|nr:ATP-binding cassette sub- G member 2 [Haplosporangium bisporale]